MWGRRSVELACYLYCGELPVKFCFRVMMGLVVCSVFESDCVDADCC